MHDNQRPSQASDDQADGGRSDDLLTLPEMAKWVRVPVATARYWRHQGIGPKSARIGRRVMYRRSDVEAWLDEQFTGATA